MDGMVSALAIILPIDRLSATTPTKPKQLEEGLGTTLPRSNVDCRNPSACDALAMRFGVHFVVILLAPVSLAQSGRCDLLPSQAKVLLDQRFPEWRPKLLSDLSGYDKKLWLETHPKGCSGIAIGHFEHPARVGYAVLLIPESGHTGSYKIIVLSKGPDEYAVRLLDHAEGSTYSDSGLVISKEPHGTYSEFGDTKSVRLKLDGVNVEWLEKSSVLYYWEHGKYRSIQTSD